MALIDEASLGLIKRRAPDSLLNGMAIGAGVGLALMLPVLDYCGGECLPGIPEGAAAPCKVYTVVYSQIQESPCRPQASPPS